MIKIQNVSYKYKNDTQALENLNLQIKEGEVLSIIGKNGSGKSTIAKLIAGITNPTSRRNFCRRYKYQKQKRIYKA